MLAGQSLRASVVSQLLPCPTEVSDTLVDYTIAFEYAAHFAPPSSRTAVCAISFSQEHDSSARLLPYSLSMHRTALSCINLVLTGTHKGVSPRSTEASQHSKSFECKCLPGVHSPYELELPGPMPSPVSHSQIL